MDIHEFKVRLERTEKRIQCAAFSEKNKKIIFDYKRHLFIKDLSTARIDKHLSVLKKIGEKINKTRWQPNSESRQMILIGRYSMRSRVISQKVIAQ